MSRTGRIEWPYSGRPHHRRGSLASSTRRLVSTVCMMDVLTYSCPKAHSLGGSFVYLVGYLGIGSDLAHTVHHQAHGRRLSFRITQAKRSAHCNDVCHHVHKAVACSGNDARVVCVHTFFSRCVRITISSSPFRCLRIRMYVKARGMYHFPFPRDTQVIGRALVYRSHSRTSNVILQLYKHVFMTCLSTVSSRNDPSI